MHGYRHLYPCLCLIIYDTSKFEQQIFLNICVIKILCKNSVMVCIFVQVNFTRPLPIRVNYTLYTNRFLVSSHTKYILYIYKNFLFSPWNLERLKVLLIFFPKMLFIDHNCLSIINFHCLFSRKKTRIV